MKRSRSMLNIIKECIHNETKTTIIDASTNNLGQIKIEIGLSKHASELLMDIFINNSNMHETMNNNDKQLFYNNIILVINRITSLIHFLNISTIEIRNEVFTDVQIILRKLESVLKEEEILDNVQHILHRVNIKKDIQYIVTDLHNCYKNYHLKYYNYW